MEQEQVQLQQEDRSPSNIVGGRDETASEEEKPGAQAGQLGEGVAKNLMENPDNKAALTTEGEIGAALNAATIEPEGDRAMAIEENIELVTIESSPEWRGGTLIEEEQPEEQENIPSTSAVNPDVPAPQKKTPQRKRKRSIKELNITSPIRRKRAKSAAATEAARKRWATLEA